MPNLQSRITSYLVVLVAYATGLAAQQPGSRLDRRMEARILYLRGQQLYDTFGPGTGVRSGEFAARAIRTDSTYAPSWALLGTSQLASNRTAAKSSAERAIRLDSMYAPGWVVLGRVQMADRDFPAAERSFLRAKAIAPQDYRAHYYHGLLRTALGHYAEGLQNTQRAFEMEPMQSGDASVQPLFALGRYDELLALCQTGLAVDSNQTENTFYQFIGYIQLERGQNEPALRALARQREVRGLPPFAHSWAWARAGREAEARTTLTSLVTAPNPTQAQQLMAAALYANLRQPDSAFAWLERAFPQGGMTDLKWHPQWTPIRSDPRFKDLIRRVGLDG